jgi:hypothetical protein
MRSREQQREVRLNCIASGELIPCLPLISPLKRPLESACRRFWGGEWRRCSRVRCHDECAGLISLRMLGLVFFHVIVAMHLSHLFLFCQKLRRVRRGILLLLLLLLYERTRMLERGERLHHMWLRRIVV